MFHAILFELLKRKLNDFKETLHSDDFLKVTFHRNEKKVLNTNTVYGGTISCVLGRKQYSQIYLIRTNMKRVFRFCSTNLKQQNALLDGFPANGTTFDLIAAHLTSAMSAKEYHVFDTIEANWAHRLKHTQKITCKKHPIR